MFCGKYFGTLEKSYMDIVEDTYGKVEFIDQSKFKYFSLFGVATGVSLHSGKFEFLQVSAGGTSVAVTHPIGIWNWESATVQNLKGVTAVFG
jgi:hypothetical protein